MPATSSSRFPSIGWPAMLASLVLALGCANGCGNPSAAQGGASAPTAATDEQDERQQEDEEAIAVRLGAVARDAISATYATSATLRADKSATVTSRTAGVVKQLLVEEGDWVEAEQVLAVLEDDEQRIEHERADFVAQTKAREFERAQSLHRQGLLSDEEFEIKRRESEEAHQTAQMAELILERTRIRASFAGRVTRRHLDVGNTVTNGTPFYDIADLSPLYADVNVPERHIERLKAGQQVRLYADSSGTATRARIERLAPIVDPATGTVKVTLAVDGGPSLRPGSFVRVEIVTDTHADTLVVPRSALVAEGRRWHVFRLQDDGRTVSQVEVTRGFEDGDRVEVAVVADGGVSRDGSGDSTTSNSGGGTEGLAAGDRVVIVGASALTDGSVVRAMDEGDGAERVASDGRQRDAA